MGELTIFFQNLFGWHYWTRTTFYWPISNSETFPKASTGLLWAQDESRAATKKITSELNHWNSFFFSQFGLFISKWWWCRLFDIWTRMTMENFANHLSHYPINSFFTVHRLFINHPIDLIIIMEISMELVDVIARDWCSYKEIFGRF